MRIRQGLINTAVFGAAFAVIAGALWWQQGGSLAAASAMPSIAGARSAPDFPAGLDWINTAGKPVHMAELKGKVVLLDFWTYGCINCFHVIPDLKKLKKKYGNVLAVIGVHSAKFKSEASTRRIRSIAQRYERTEPIVNDKDFEVWRNYGVNAWPTLVLIDPAGNIVGKVAGEGHYNLLDEAITRLLVEFKDQLNTMKLATEPALDDMAKTFLKFPGKLAVHAATRRLFIADSNHNRIVVSDYDGKVQMIIGDGKEGLQDGSFADAEFHQPQGIAVADADTLYIADTLNSAIRKVDFKAGTVTTVAGTGRQSHMSNNMYPAKGTDLNTPWDVAWIKNQLYIAMAGQHQIWTWNPANDQLLAYAGSRSEGIDDGPKRYASLAQPSGLAWDGDERLYFADPESSSVRYVDMTSEQVETIAGTGLFDFGDVDGVGRNAQLQHPLGLAYANKVLYVTDTYNDKIKVIDPATRRSTTLLGGDGSLSEPGGIAYADGMLFIADTNHHAIKRYDLNTRKLVDLKVGQ